MNTSPTPFARLLTAVVEFLRAGYPAGAPVQGYAPLLALAPPRGQDGSRAAE